MPASKTYTAQRKAEIHKKGHDRLLAIAHKVQEFAKINIERAVYQTPESPDYLRTGLAKASIHTVDKGNYMLVGANKQSFEEDAAKLGIVKTGGVTFYLPFIEKGHLVHSAKGDWFYPARPFLVPALDEARMKYGR